MKTSNKAPASEWTLACTGPQLCPPFSSHSSEGTMGTLDTPLKRGRRSTILRDKKGALCWRSHWKRTDKTLFRIPPGKRHPRWAQPLQTALSHDNSQTKGEPETQASQRDMHPIRAGLGVSLGTPLIRVFTLGPKAAPQTLPTSARKDASAW